MSDLVRPFVITGGRTRVGKDLRVETMVQTARDDRGDAPFEAGRILALCQAPQSIAEIAAALPVPLGVARVLVADLVDGHRLVVHHSDPVDIELSVLTRMIEHVESL